MNYIDSSSVLFYRDQELECVEKNIGCTKITSYAQRSLLSRHKMDKKSPLNRFAIVIHTDRFSTLYVYHYDTCVTQNCPKFIPSWHKFYKCIQQLLVATGKNKSWHRLIWPILCTGIHVSFN